MPQGLEHGRVDHGPYQGNLGNYAWPNRDDIDNPRAPDWYRERHDHDPEGTELLADPETGETVPKPGCFFGINANRLDPAWYHQEGFIAGGDWESAYLLQHKHLASDCIDLATERENAKEYLIGSINRYLDMGVDALRIDIVKRIDRDNLLEYVNAWKAHKPELFVFGENLVKGYDWGAWAATTTSPHIRPWWYTRLGDDPHDPESGRDSGFPQLDFGLFSTFRDNLSRGSFDGVGRALEMNWIYGNAPSWSPSCRITTWARTTTFAFASRVSSGWRRPPNLLWTVHGIPCLYFGEEIEFMKGTPQDIIGNDDTLENTGRAYFGDRIDDAYIAETQNHSLYRHIQRLNRIRRAIPAVQKTPHGPARRVGLWPLLRPRLERWRELRHRRG